MFAPELLLLFGLLMVIGSLIALTVAQSKRNWFFYADSLADMKFVNGAHRPGTER